MWSQSFIQFVSHSLSFTQISPFFFFLSSDDGKHSDAYLTGCGGCGGASSLAGAGVGGAGVRKGAYFVGHKGVCRLTFAAQAEADALEAAYQDAVLG